MNVCPTMKSRFVQLVTICSTAIRQFVPWVGDHVLLESSKERVQKTPEPTQQELVVEASKEAVSSKTVDVGQFFRTRPICNAHGRSTTPCCKKNTRSIIKIFAGSSTISRHIQGTTNIGAVVDVFVSEDQGLFSCALTLKYRHHCTVLHGYEQVVEIHEGHVNRLISHQTYAGTDCVFFFFFQNGGTAIAQAQPEDPDLCIGRPIAFHPEIAPPPPPDRLHPGHTDSARVGIG